MVDRPSTTWQLLLGTSTTIVGGRSTHTHLLLLLAVFSQGVWTAKEAVYPVTEVV
jgi:hypothetical protein